LRPRRDRRSLELPDELSPLPLVLLFRNDAFLVECLQLLQAFLDGLLQTGRARGGSSAADRLAREPTDAAEYFAWLIADQAVAAVYAAW
jgi:hypothetical protein